MAVELEREKTYLAAYMPTQINGARFEIIEDVYVPEESDHANLRLRNRGSRFEITKKQPVKGNDSSRQTEHTTPLSEEEYTALIRVSAKRLRKTRYYCTIYGHEAEVDVYMDKLEGLVLIDFEFDSDEALESFRPPEVCLADVTQDIVSAAGRLAGKSYQDIKKGLEKYNYKPLYMEGTDEL